MSPLWILLLLPLLGGAERFNCKGRILGAYYADAKSGCKAFHVCVRVAGGGIRDFRFFCPPGTLFHQEAQTCTDWGDDDPLACPADIYDGQFDLYKIGSGFDTKKVSTSANREEEAEFGLQRADTGDRRLAQNNAPSGPASDLRAAHSSDFFSGQRDRGRDEPAQPSPSSTPYPRQSFRRSTTPRPQPTTTQYIAPTSQPPAPSQYDVPKRKLVRKRPIYVSTAAPTTAFVQNNPPQPTQPPQSYSKPPQTYSQPPQTHSQPPQTHSQPPQTYSQPPQSYSQPPQSYSQPPQSYSQPPQSYSQPPQSYSQPPKQYRRVPKPHRETLPPPPNVPPQYKEYKDEYVEVSRVTPKQNRYIPNQSNQSPKQSSQTKPAQHFQKKEGLIEVYNYEAQSTPGLNSQSDKQQPFKIRNNFSVSDSSKEADFLRTRNQNNNFNNARGTAPTTDYTVTRGPAPTTVAYNNHNSVSYENNKNNFIPYSKQNFFNSPTTTPPAATTITVYTTTRPEPPPNVNTVAYNTNIGFHSQSNFADSGEDDGQYRLPQGEDDGQYRPELYERELLSGAHSLNIAASGNRLPEDQKPRGKTQSSPKHGQTSVPRPFRPASTTLPPRPPPTQTTTKLPETYPTTLTSSPNTQRTFDYFQTYTTTSRPSEFPETTTTARPTTTTPAPRPARPPHYARPPSNKEDNSYDYAYYDSDPGFSEYDHIEEFGRTKTRA